jgi:hypothetical protein
VLSLSFFSLPLLLLLCSGSPHHSPLLPARAHLTGYSDEFDDVYSTRSFDGDSASGVQDVDIESLFADFGTTTPPPGDAARQLRP